MRNSSSNITKCNLLKITLVHFSIISSIKLSHLKYQMLNLTLFNQLNKVQKNLNPHNFLIKYSNQALFSTLTQNLSSLSLSQYRKSSRMLHKNKIYQLLVEASKFLIRKLMKCKIKLIWINKKILLQKISNSLSKLKE
jgi:hypothetical protein